MIRVTYVCPTCKDKFLSQAGLMVHMLTCKNGACNVNVMTSKQERTTVKRASRGTTK